MISRIWNVQTNCTKQANSKWEEDDYNSEYGVVFFNENSWEQSED